MRYGGNYWLRHIRCHLLGYRILRHKEGLGYGDVKFLAALGAAFMGLLTTTGFPCCLIRLRSRSYWSAHERKRIIKTRCLLGHFWRLRVSL